LRLVTFPPLPPFPERKLPRFSRRMALATALLAPWLYFRRLDFFFAGMTFSCPLENLFREEVVPAYFRHESPANTFRASNRQPVNDQPRRTQNR
jgi:hypothetical protein